VLMRLSPLIWSMAERLLHDESHMKLLLLMGGLLGFAIGIGFGLVHEQSLPRSGTCLCCAVIGAMLMRWWGRVWIKACRTHTRSAIMTRPATNCIEAPRPRPQQFARAIQGRAGQRSRGELLRRHLPLVKTVWADAMTLPPHVDLDDLNSAGVVGLLNALRNFDETNGANSRLTLVCAFTAVMDELRRMISSVAAFVTRRARCSLSWRTRTETGTVAHRRGNGGCAEDFAGRLLRLLM